jgi:hypothetical protein
MFFSTAGVTSYTVLVAPFLVDSGFELLSLQNRRQLSHLCRIRARGVQKGSARTIDGARVVVVQGQDVPRLARGIVEIDVGQTFPASPDANHFASDFRPAVDHRFDYGVQSGDVTATGEYAYALICHESPFMYEEVNIRRNSEVDGLCRTSPSKPLQTLHSIDCQPVLQT